MLKMLKNNVILILNQDDYYITEKYNGLDELELSISVNDAYYPQITEEARNDKRDNVQSEHCLQNRMVFICKYQRKLQRCNSIVILSTDEYRVYNSRNRHFFHQYRRIYWVRQWKTVVNWLRLGFGNVA